MAKELKEGSKAPAFTMKRDGGGTVKLSELKGKIVVLYFYPKDDTSGCTKEAIAFTEHKKKFDRIGAEIIGVSRDTVEKHDKFIDKHKLKVTLGSDENGKVTEAYGVWQEKKMYGRTFMGIVRSTFLIDQKGVIRKIWPKVKVAGHAEEVLEAAKALKD